jgi:hypothetical protein
VFRCWKVEQWAYNLKDEAGETLWGNVKEGKEFHYSSEDVNIHLVAIEGKFNVWMGANVKFKDGVREVKGLEIQGVNKVSEKVVESEPVKKERPKVLIADVIDPKYKKNVQVQADSPDAQEVIVVAETKKEVIIRLLKVGLPFKEIVEQTGADISYVRKLNKVI